MNFAVIGAGAWGTTLADLLAGNRHSVRLWAREPEVVEGISRNKRNPFFVPDLEISSEVFISSDIQKTLSDAEIVLFTVPSAHLRKVLREAGRYLPANAGILNAAKGLEPGVGLRLSLVFLEELGLKENSDKDRIAVLSGPNLAPEIAARKSGAAVIASPDEKLSTCLQKAFSNRYFRVYRHSDRAGVELGGTLKNIYSIGAGIVDGLGLGDNAKAAYLTRSLHEMVRLGTRLGGRTTTFYGLSGLGDLMATAASPLSRNQRLGQAIARNEREKFFSDQSRMAIEGVETARMARDWGKKLTIPLPITEEICRVLFENKSTLEATRDLMTRSLKDEEE